MTVLESRDYLFLITVFNGLNNLTPHYLLDLFVHVSDVHSLVTKQTNIGALINVDVPECGTVVVRDLTGHK